VTEQTLLKSALARAGNAAVQTSESPGVTVAELGESYLTDRKLPVKMRQEVRTIASRFGQTIGRGEIRAARLVTRADVRRYRATVLASDRSVSTMKKQLDCRESGRFGARRMEGAVQPCINIAGWSVAPFLLIRSYGPPRVTRKDSSAYGLR
jgi:hypothetical protein